MPLVRRFPLLVAPIPFLGGLLVCAIGAFAGLNWNWQWSVQTGNVLLMVSIPANPVRASGLAIAGLVVALAGAAFALRFGVRTPRRAIPGRSAWRRFRFRFFPAAFGMGLFLVGFGVSFLFDASFYGDLVPGGAVLFVYLEYAGLLDRLLVTTFGLLVTAAGGCVLLRGSFARLDAPGRPWAAVGPRVANGAPPGVGAWKPWRPAREGRTVSPRGRGSARGRPAPPVARWVERPRTRAAAESAGRTQGGWRS